MGLNSRLDRLERQARAEAAPSRRNLALLTDDELRELEQIVAKYERTGDLSHEDAGFLGQLLNERPGLLLDE
ncbi:MAG: hypothetical protein M1401_07955 [Chloroflexi bacterium]|nr:hypothetical protein [Chloroflexota bacterium]